jgi:hypothetical protein
LKLVVPRSRAAGLDKFARLSKKHDEPRKLINCTERKLYRLLFLDQRIFQGFAHGEMQRLPWWDIHDRSGFGIFCAPGFPAADTEAAESADFDAASIAQGIGNGVENDIDCPINILFQKAVGFLGHFAYQIALQHNSESLPLSPWKYW